MDIKSTIIFSAAGLALYVAHYVGDYWVQTHEQSMHKGSGGARGRGYCVMHVATYVLTQMAFLAVLELVLGLDMSWAGLNLAMLVSGVTHYMADRREHGLMFKLARKIPGKAQFLELGKPRVGMVIVHDGQWESAEPIDNPSLGTGAWALDQSWHLFWGVFVAALIIASLS